MADRGAEGTGRDGGNAGDGEDGRVSPPADTGAAAPVDFEITVNGDRVRRSVPPSRTLLEFLRYDLGLTGSKQGCDKGDCGACTVIQDGKAVLSCITLALEAAGSEVETVESLAEGTTLRPLQDFFVRYGAAQCGFCTPGILMSAKVLLDRSEHGAGRAPAVPSRDEIKLALSGNLCRCTGYTKILDAVEDAARTLAGMEPANLEGSPQ